MPKMVSSSSARSDDDEGAAQRLVVATNGDALQDVVAETAEADVGGEGGRRDDLQHAAAQCRR